jgi:hemoglobin-like flavoprotein
MMADPAQTSPLTGFDALFDGSYERVKTIKKNNKSFFDAFYDNFMNSSDEIKRHFRNTDMQKQKKMLEKSFYSLFIFYATNNANDYLNNIAVRHSKSHTNVSPELYEVWLDSLMKTVKEYDPHYNHDVELSWRVVLAPGIAYMKFKYDK